MTQVILYDEQDVATWQRMRTDGIIPDGPWFLLFVLGRYTANQTSSPTDLLPFLQRHDGQYPGPCAHSVLKRTPAPLPPQVWVVTFGLASRTTFS